MNTIQQLNSVTLRGIVGNVRVSNMADTRIVNMTVATNYAYKSQVVQSVIIETTWHHVVGFEKTLKIDLDKLSKGDKVEIKGRIRNQRYTGEDGVERAMSEIMASQITRLDLEENLQFEM